MTTQPVFDYDQTFNVPITGDLIELLREGSMVFDVCYEPEAVPVRRTPSPMPGGVPSSPPMPRKGSIAESTMSHLPVLTRPRSNTTGCDTVSPSQSPSLYDVATLARPDCMIITVS